MRRQSSFDFEDQVVLTILAFRFAAIRVTNLKIRSIEGKPPEIARSTKFTFLQIWHFWMLRVVIDARIVYRGVTYM